MPVPSPAVRAAGEGHGYGPVAPRTFPLKL